jgi:hypothetical protein
MPSAIWEEGTGISIGEWTTNIQIGGGSMPRESTDQKPTSLNPTETQQMFLWKSKGCFCEPNDIIAVKRAILIASELSSK